MKKIMYFLPAVLALILYIALGFIAGFKPIEIWVWFWLSVMFLSAAVMLNNRWYGCIGGFVVGCVLIYMGTQYTGQVINVEIPLGIILCVYYFVCGIIVYKNAKG